MHDLGEANGCEDETLESECHRLANESDLNGLGDTKKVNAVRIEASNCTFVALMESYLESDVINRPLPPHDTHSPSHILNPAWSAHTRWANTY